jgi:hypothetical protein
MKVKGTALWTLGERDIGIFSLARGRRKVMRSPRICYSNVNVFASFTTFDIENLSGDSPHDS